MLEIVRHTQRNVKRWQDGDMRKRWTAAGMLVAEQQFRRIIGYRELATLVIAVERHALLAAANMPDRHQITEPVTVRPSTHRRSPPKFHDDPDILRRSLPCGRSTGSTRGAGYCLVQHKRRKPLAAPAVWLSDHPERQPADG